jgi:hypothetical protein
MERISLPFEERITLGNWNFVSPEDYLKEHEKTLSPDFWLKLADEDPNGRASVL